MFHSMQVPQSQNMRANASAISQYIKFSGKQIVNMKRLLLFVTLAYGSIVNAAIVYQSTQSGATPIESCRFIGYQGVVSGDATYACTNDDTALHATGQNCNFYYTSIGGLWIRSYVLCKYVPESGSLPPLEPNPKTLGLGLCANKTHNPIDFSFGNKIFTATDYRGSGPYPIAFTHTYNSMGTTLWSFSYRQRIAYTPGTSNATVWRPDGAGLSFWLISSVWTPDSDVTSRLQMLGDGSWIYTLPDNTREYYDNVGRLTAIRNSYGQQQTITYDSDGNSFTVADAQGNTFHVEMNANGKTPKIITDSQGNTIIYTYDPSDYYLQGVAYPGGKSKQYLYELAAKPNLITGIIDENGHRSNTVTYNSDGRAISSELADGAERMDVAYNPDGTATLTNVLGKQSIYTFQTIQGVRKIVHVEGEPTATCQGTAMDYTFDSNGFLKQIIDALGVITTYTRNTVGLEISRTEAVGTADARTITHQWDTTTRLPLLITEGNRQTSFTYDTDGRLLTRTVTDTSLSQSRSTSYTYNALGLLASVDGPRTDVSDVTTYGYDSNGYLTTITNALGHSTTIVTRNYQGRPTLIRDPNGLETSLAYDVRGRLQSTSTGSETTTFIYDGVGNVTQVSPPDGAVVNYAYDNANRLIKITDAIGNYVNYTVDLQGNRTSEKVYGSGNTLLLSHTRVYDELSRLIQSIGALNQTTLYGYDKNDNLVTTTDPQLHLYQNGYDALNRLIQQTDPLMGITQYGYDALDRLTSVTDPNLHTTTYTYNAFGDLLSQSSPDTGVTTYSYDNGGNLTRRTDAKGQTTTYAYDALNRRTQQGLADGKSLAYSYDTALNGIGRLAVSSSASGTTSYSYNSHGRIAARVEAINKNRMFTQLTTRYSYNGKGQLKSMTYPSGKVVGYEYNSKGRLITLTLDGQPLLANIKQQVFGAVKGWSWANGQSYSRSFNKDGRLSSYSSNTGSKSLGYDANGNITDIGSAVYGYDPINRLIAANDAAFNLAWSYDANGNRINEMSGENNHSYTLSNSSNRLLAVDSTLYQYDANGSLISNGSSSYQYDVQGRLVSVNNGATGLYRYNAQGQRVYKWAQQQGAVDERLFAYDDWRLLGEYGATGIAKQETIWVGDLPVATLQNGTVYNIYPDHLGTPRLITNAANTAIWKWEGEPFGSAPANEDPDGDGVRFSYSLRFPGQYFDAETGLHYNYFRDYEPHTGRYIESDPIGLGGGLNTFAYVNGNPVVRLDLFGLKANCECYATGPAGQYRLNPSTGKNEKECMYRCTCTCEGKKNSPEPFETKAHSNRFSSERWDYGSGVCINQKGFPPDFPASSFSFETGLVDPSDFQKKYGIKPYPDPICSDAPELCKAADKKCTECQQ